MIVLYNYDPNVFIEDYNMFLDENTDEIIFEFGVQMIKIKGIKNIK